MELSLYLARAWGLFTVLLCIGLFLNQKRFMSALRQMNTEYLTILVAGSIALGLGVAQVVGYESWTPNYKGLITILGWAALIKGAAILFVPSYMERFTNVLTKGSWYMPVVGLFLVLGAYLLYMGLTG